MADGAPEPVAVYRETRARVGELVVGLDADAVRAPVPACPGWSVQDVVSHMVGIIADLQDGRLDGVGTDAWTLAQVTARRDLPIADVVAEWNRRGPVFEEQVATWPPSVAAQLVSDAAMHELDIRAALGDAGARDTHGVAIALDYYGRKLGDRITEAGLGALMLELASGTVTLGEGDPAATVRAPDFEALRAMGGRRNADQMRALDWTGDAEPYVALMSSYGSREEPLVE